MNDLTTYDIETGEVDVAPITQLPATDLGEINMQIATARAYPRSIKQVSARIYSLVTLDEESAEECVYALPRGGKPIKGPSIRFAEALMQSYGNCRAAARVVEINRVEKYIEAEGMFFDLETNTATSARVRRRISDKYGKVYKDDMILVTGNAASSIAKRNAILGGVPKPIWRAAYAQANSVISGDVTTLAVNREKAMKSFAVFGVTPDQIYTALGVNGSEDITVDHIGTLRGMHATLKNAEATVEEMFAPAVSERASDASYNPVADAANQAKNAQKSKSDQLDTSKPASIVEPNASKNSPPSPSPTGQKSNSETPDTEIIRAGVTAARDAEDREPPEGLSDFQRNTWFDAYDKTYQEMEDEAGVSA